MLEERGSRIALPDNLAEEARERLRRQNIDLAYAGVGTGGYPMIVGFVPFAAGVARAAIVTHCDRCISRGAGA